MARSTRSQAKVEFGDFQTPQELAGRCCALLARRGFAPHSVLEPTCGRGTFLLAALEAFPCATRAVGVDIDPAHILAARQRVREAGDGREVLLLEDDFFTADWQSLLASLPSPLLVIGNPPWVTNAGLGQLGSTNLPAKSNFRRYAGIEAITGKSNFDISEWMLLRALDWLDGRTGALAVLCKTAVARKVLSHAWGTGMSVERADLYRVDAAAHFGASVDASFLVMMTAPGCRGTQCRRHEGLDEDPAPRLLGVRDGRLVADIEHYNRWRHLAGSAGFEWRSGVKHDCAGVFELRREGSRFRNGLGELVDLEPDYVFPLMKSSNLASERGHSPLRWMLLPQRAVGKDTAALELSAPMAWRYLCSHADRLSRRASSIYKGRPRFSVFGVGPYSFSDWKVAVAGLYKKLLFRPVGPFERRPVLFDDTCYFLPCGSQQEAESLADLLNSEAAKQFFSAFVFWDAKRPITAELLRTLNLLALAKHLRVKESVLQDLERLQAFRGTSGQPSLFSDREGVS